MKIRREVYIVLAVVLVIALFVIFRPKGTKKIESTNLDKIKIETSATDGYINFGDNDRVALSNPPGIFLICNGNIVKNASIKAFEGSSMIPSEKFAEVIGAELKTSEKNGDEFTLKKDDISITFRLNDQNYENGDKSAFLDVVPLRDGKLVYVPLKQFFELFGYQIIYTDGIKVTSDRYPVIPMYQQIFAYNYNEKLTPKSREDAIKSAQETFKACYKTVFKEKYKSPDDKMNQSSPSEQDAWRIAIDNLSIKYENDRYYFVAIDGVNDLLYMLDKYTDDVYEFSSGQTYSYKLLDKKDPVSLKRITN
ncbi:MAG: stalk domain-containing protein [Ezakiella sp.]|nr:stalk domain-containing protein [Bacillota bacterium]MDY3946993.1 stalk domain-containing protein [Ezakiella sp.]